MEANKRFAEKREELEGKVSRVVEANTRFREEIDELEQQKVKMAEEHKKELGER